MEKNNALIFKRGLEILKKTSGKIVLTAASFALITSLAACGQATDQKTVEPEEPTDSVEPPHTDVEVNSVSINNIIYYCEDRKKCIK